MADRAYRVVLMRGGSSRALMFRGEDLPSDRASQDRIFLRALGCPDPTGRQVDGLGGGASSNNKVAIVTVSERPGVDVDYTFGQLSPDRPFVDRAGNCGNISSAVGPFAVDEGMVMATGDLTQVTIRNTNTDRTIVAHVPTSAGRFQPEGEFAIAGVAGTGSKIVMDFADPSGADTGTLLPSGHPRDQLNVPGVGPVSCSLVDAGKACVLVPFGELGLQTDTRPDQIDADQALLARIEAIRAIGAVAMGLASNPSEVTATMPAVPQLTAFEAAGPRALRVLGISMGKAHRTLPLTAAVCIAAAAVTPGTLVHSAIGEEEAHKRGGQTGAGRKHGERAQSDGEQADQNADQSDQASVSNGVAAAELQLDLLHPSGQMKVVAAARSHPDRIVSLWRVSVERTARRLLDGVVYVRPELHGGT